MKFSIIIPAYNEEKYVGATILALQKQTIPRDEYEIIVVDNNSTDHTSEVAHQSGADKVVMEMEKGTNMARGRGIREASGEILAFVDADSEPPIDWLEKIEHGLIKKRAAAISGPYDHGFSGFKAFVDKLYTGFLMPRLDRILYFIFHRKAGVLIGGNFAMWRSTLDKIGGLPKLAFWGDDCATAMLVSRHVGRVVFDPSLRIKSSPRRFEKSGFLKPTLRYMFTYIKIYFDKRFN